MPARACLLASAMLALAACSNEPPSWPRLIEARIVSHYPAAKIIHAPDALMVQLDGRDHRIELAPVILQCNRGISDCEHAMTGMLLELAQEQR